MERDVQEGRPDARTWSDALRLYEWVCTFVGVAPREHDDWWLDVGAITRLETRDPRGWKGDRPDFYAQPSRSHDPFSTYDWDAGLIAVNDDEAAVLWNFQST
ncbi:hypothetical protein ACFY04_00915 [Streptomyces sp. NPDC001549]|uniref:hypothetical protein n=1 Tax=Streptomyces sp. NPDC001549 TaxID=3364586 RepID=UPI0036758BB1